MPFKSKAQRKKFYQLHKEGKIDTKTLNEYEKASKGKKLPNRITSKKKKTTKKKNSKKK